jgi:putative beta-barrel porin BBP2
VNRPRSAGSGRRLPGAALACVLASLTGAATATQGSPSPADPDLSTEGMRRAGPFHLRPFAVLKDVGYDDNIRFEAGIREGDSTATAGAGIDAVLLAGDRGGLRLFQEGDYVTFQRNADLDHWNGAARARGVLLLKRAVLSLEERYTSDRERPTSEIDQRVRRNNNAVTAAVRTLGQGRLAVKSYLRDERIDYGSDDPALGDVGARLNRDETTLSVIGELQLLPKTTVTLEWAVSSIAFDDTSQARDTRKRALLPGFRFDPTAAVQGDLRAGPLAMTALDRDGGDYHGLVGDGHLTTRVGRAGRVKTGFGRNVEFSTLGNNLYYVGSQWSAAYEQFFSRRVSGELSYGRGLNHYPNEVPSAENSAVLLIRDDRLATWQATVRYRANPQTTIGLSAYHVRRDSTDDFYDRTRNFYTFGTTYSF